MKRTILATTAAVALVSLVTACGADSSTDDPAAAPGASDTIASTMILGGPAEFQTRSDGVPGLAETYGVSFAKYQVTDTGGPVTINQLKNGQIDAADLFSTDPSIAANDFVVLADPKNNFAAENVVPVINKNKVTPGVSSTLNAISAKLDTEGLSAALAKVVTDKANPADVAKEWLRSNGLDSTGTAAQGTNLTVGSANFPENVLLATIYTQALQAQGADISTSFSIGSREKYFPGLQDGSIDLIPEYTGSALSYLDKDATATSPDEVYAALQKALPASLQVLEKSAAQDADCIVVTRATAEKHNLKTIADLANKK
ncbi:glycine betaine ABC transporter substrate-binding protein [Rhodococcus sp. X156]|uniref:glycine betaine ABC transporter substrate-binding protein n=1 Tax=Rhodococcus sp. X156 TaxID=2499145 RepID=UPI000FDB264B|nr:glycine betaine ABC transporter substrate-binding protein [Rhodococcus sp. X156]